MTKKLKKRLKMLILSGILFLLFILTHHLVPWSVFGNGFLTFLLPLLLSVALYLFIGRNVWIKAVKNLFHGRVFDENFLMAVATVGAFMVGEYEEAVAVMLFYEIGEWFQDYAVGKSRRSVSELMKMAPETAVIEDRESGELKTVDPSEIAVGDICVVKPGEKIPTDGYVLDGETALDTSSLTGESAYRNVYTGDPVSSGCIAVDGKILVKASKVYEDSTVAKILDLVENATNKKAPVENFITKFAKYYTPLVIFGAVILALIPPIFFDGVWSEWIRRACTFLVISCPCALVISVPLGFFGGIGAASRHGILIKGSTFLETLTQVETVAFDKTGTVTKAEFSVERIESAGVLTEKEILHIAAYAERFSHHPIASAIVKKDAEVRAEGWPSMDENLPADSVTSGETLNKTFLQDALIKEHPGYGLEVIGKDCTYFIGNAAWMKKQSLSVSEEDTGKTRVFLADKEKILGVITLSDMLKSGVKETIEKLRAYGLKRLILLTGDKRIAAEEIARETGLDEVYADLLPADKEQLIRERKTETGIAFVGDGMNDAPSLITADVGISMGALGSDAAIEAADIVLMDDDIRHLPTAFGIAKKTMRIVRENIVFALFIKALVLLLGALGIAGMWLAMFADVGVAVLAIVNSMRTLSHKTDS